MRKIGGYFNFRGGEFYMALVFLLFLVMVGVYWFLQENGSNLFGVGRERGSEVAVELPEVGDSSGGGISAVRSLSGVLVSFDSDEIGIESDGVETIYPVVEDVLISRIDRSGQFVEEGQASLTTVRLSREDLEVGVEITLVFDDISEKIVQIIVFE